MLNPVTVHVTDRLCNVACHGNVAFIFISVDLYVLSHTIRIMVLLPSVAASYILQSVGTSLSIKAFKC